MTLGLSKRSDGGCRLLEELRRRNRRIREKKRSFMKGGESQGEESDMFDGFEGDRERTTRELRDFCQGIRLLRERIIWVV